MSQASSSAAEPGNAFIAGDIRDVRHCHSRRALAACAMSGKTQDTGTPVPFLHGAPALFCFPAMAGRASSKV